jgi:hypothetical protein
MEISTQPSKIIAFVGPELRRNKTEIESTILK